MLLPAVCGVVWFFWEAQVFGSSCGWRNLPVGPNGPDDTVRVVMVIIAAGLTAVGTVLEKRRLRSVVVRGALSGVFVVAAVFLAGWFYALSRNCFST